MAAPFFYDNLVTKDEVESRQKEIDALKKQLERYREKYGDLDNKDSENSTKPVSKDENLKKDVIERPDLSQKEQASAHKEAEEVVREKLVKSLDMGFLCLLAFVYGLLEEFGWRGFLQNELRDLPMWQYVLIITAMWFLWHLDLSQRHDIDMQLKESMKEYVSESETTSGNTTISGGTYSMAGKVSDYGIHMIIEIEDSTVHGDYYYDSQGSDNRVQLKGKKDENGNMKLVKYNSEGDETGYFIGIFDGSTYSGENINYKREKSLPFSVSVLRLN